MGFDYLVIVDLQVRWCGAVAPGLEQERALSQSSRGPRFRAAKPASCLHPERTPRPGHGRPVGCAQAALAASSAGRGMPSGRLASLLPGTRPRARAQTDLPEAPEDQVRILTCGAGSR